MGGGCLFGGGGGAHSKEVALISAVQLPLLHKLLVILYSPGHR